MSETENNTINNFFETYKESKVGTAVQKPNSGDENIDLLLNLFTKYGEYLFSSCEKIRPTLEIKEELLFNREIFEGFLTLIRKSPNTKEMVTSLSYFKNKYSDLFDELLLHHEQVKINQNQNKNYPGELVYFFVKQVLKGSLELEGDFLSYVEDKWQTHLQACRQYRFLLMNNPEVTMLFDSLKDEDKRLLLSKFKRNDFIDALAGMDDFNFKNLISVLSDNLKKLYREDFEYAHREFEKELDAVVYMKKSIAFLNIVEELFSFSMNKVNKEFAGEDDVFLNKLDKKDKQNELDENDNTTAQDFISAVTSETINREEIKDGYFQCIEHGDLEDDVLVCLLSKYTLLRKIKNKALLDNIHRVFLKVVKDKIEHVENITLISQKGLPSLQVNFNYIENLHKKMLELNS
jgi:hypothetical protein